MFWHVLGIYSTWIKSLNTFFSPSSSISRKKPRFQRFSIFVALILGKKNNWNPKSENLKNRLNSRKSWKNRYFRGKPPQSNLGFRSQKWSKTLFKRSLRIKNNWFLELLQFWTIEKGNYLKLVGKNLLNNKVLVQIYSFFYFWNIFLTF